MTWTVWLILGAIALAVVGFGLWCIGLAAVAEGDEEC